MAESQERGSLEERVLASSERPGRPAGALSFAALFRPAPERRNVWFRRAYILMAGIFEEHILNRLAKRMQRGDRRAAEEMYNHLVGRVFGFCMNRVGNRNAAEDLAQDIFVKLIGRIGTFDQARGSFSIWFWQLARNAVTDHYRSRRELSFSDIGDEAVEDVAGSSIQFSEHAFEIGRVRNFLKTLLPEERELFELRFVADLPYRTIAAMLGKSEGTLRVAVSRLKAKMRSALKS